MRVKPVIVVGHAALDRVYRIDAFPPKPTKVRALEHREEGGGSAANAAAAVARLGGAVTFWGRVGDDETGDKVKRALERVGVDVTSVRSCSAAITPTAAVIVDGRGERLVVSEDDHVMPMEADWLPTGQVRSSSAVLSDLSWLEGTEAAFMEARALGVPTVLDVDLGGGSLLARLLPLADFAIFSAPAFEKHVEGSTDDARLSALIEAGVRHAGVTRGAAGYVWKSRAGSGVQAGFRVPVVDTTGAGDTFHGAFAYALGAGFEEAECARVAAAAAALKCRRLGARLGLPTAAELDAFLMEQTGQGLAAPLLEDGLMADASEPRVSPDNSGP